MTMNTLDLKWRILVCAVHVTTYVSPPGDGKGRAGLSPSWLECFPEAASDQEGLVKMV